MIDVLLKLGKRFGATTSIVVLSQAISASSLLLLPFLGLAVADVYAFAIQIAVGPYNGLVMGVIYLLVIGRPHFAAWGRMRFLAGTFSLLLTLAALAYVASHGSLYKLPLHTVLAITAICGLSGTALAIASIRGVQEACAGRPTMLAGITIVSNLSMGLTTAVVAVLAHQSQIGAILPALSGFAANGALAIWSLAAASSVPPTHSQIGVDGDRQIIITQTFGLMLGVIASTVFPIGYIAAVGKLRTGSATVLFLASRMGSAVIGILINSVLLVQHNWKSTKTRLGPFSLTMAALSTACASIALTCRIIGLPSAVSYTVVLAAWLSSLSAAPVVSREVNRRRLGKAIAWKATADVGASGMGLAWLYRTPSVTGYFGIYMLSQGLTCAIFGLATREHRLAATSVMLTVLAAVLIGFGW